jgi:hypothetical protein
MAKSVDEAFSFLLNRLTPSEGESGSAASHRTSILQCLQSNFGMRRFFRSGYGTSVSGYSDVDYFAVVPPDKLASDSNLSLSKVAAALRSRFPFSNVIMESPAVVIPFGQGGSEKHEIIPCFEHTKYHSLDVFGIPDRGGKWMTSCPDLNGAIIDVQQQRLSQKAKPLIRLIKAWKYYNNVPLRSFYIELSVAQYLATQNSVIYKIDVRAALQYILNTNLANIPDPAGGTTPVYAGYTNDIPHIRAALSDAVSWASAALEDERDGDIAKSFLYWDLVFGRKFPGYF